MIDKMLYMEEPKLIRKRMLQSQRAAQFAPFAALSGYDDLIDEASRIVEPYRELDEQQQIQLQQKLETCLYQNQKEVLLTYFVEDLLKDGGRYVQEVVMIDKVDELHHLLVLVDGRKIRLVDIYDIC